MNILHITSHLGGGVGTVIMDWMERQPLGKHRVLCLDYINQRAITSLQNSKVPYAGFCASTNKDELYDAIKISDIVLLHYWPHPMIKQYVSKQIPPCRLIIWSHHNIEYSPKELSFPDLWIDTSLIQGHGRFIWSTGNMERFLKIEPKPHKGFNIGYVGTVNRKKIHPQFITMCLKIAEHIPDVHFTVIGENNLGLDSDSLFTFTGKVDDVAPYLAEMDVFGYLLRPDHYGTCEQALGEAMAAGVVPVVMDNPAERMIVNNYENGLVANSEKDYIECIEMLANCPADERLNYAYAARERAKYLYSIDNMISQWNDVFEEMMKQPKRKRDVLCQ